MSLEIDVEIYARCVSLARERMAQIKKEHPNLSAYLVISSQTSQRPVDDSLAELLAGCCELFIDDAARAEGLRLVRTRDQAANAIDERTRQTTEARLAALRAELSDLVAAWSAHLPRLRFDPGAQLELRFNRLDYALIDVLRTHALVDRVLTPQTTASIRIVLGSLGSLSQI